MLIELEARRIILQKLKAYLHDRWIDPDSFYFDPDVNEWVVGCVRVGKTLTEAEKIIPEHL